MIKWNISVREWQGKEKRNRIDNCASHVNDVIIKLITMDSFSSNTAIKLQLIDQHAIKKHKHVKKNSL